MSYMESDYPGLLDAIEEILKDYANPSLKDYLLKELFRIYRLLPPYPGITVSCRPRLLRSQARELKTGDWISFNEGKRLLFGQVAESGEGEIRITRIQETFASEDRVLKGEETVYRVDDHQLEKHWQSLVFAGEKGEEGKDAY